MTDLTVTNSRDADGTPTLTATGEIDLSNVAEFAGALAEGVGAGTPLTVDLTGVAYLDSAALNALFTHAGQIRIVAGRLLLPVLRICGLTELTTVVQR
ncbi:STAS domain-containing protein [Saccharothrix yanglingensis]|uniref:Anti-anti-sigma factor n=1 Tax=Saccharothrix yanglingensis TaxID=659496 RepID=A0ABU0X2S1_9PSEU|nr:STAS domain-containing protein [Saccharothrix yanglingensis]MDQ2586432.1 anti-anti-sigma factor [Saccharothrix yanglingensis]